MTYDSRIDTYQHIATVRGLIKQVVANLLERGEIHDLSKLASPEKEAFDEYTPKLATSTYGSEEYRGFLAAMKPALDHHYSRCSHHPEHYRWRCGICDRRYADDQWEEAPQGPNETGQRYCPECSRDGVIYESALLAETDKGLHGMSLLDLIEMLCDWKAATLRHNDGSILRSIDINQKRFGYGDELRQILLNTVRELGLESLR
jgi:hypothetical protein